MQHSSQVSIFNAQLQAAWQEQIAAATQNRDLVPTITCRRDELFPRFAAYYTELNALPRRVRRALQRQWRLPLAGVALMLALAQSPALAATIPVNASCTLVDAITAANTDSATGGCPAGSGADTIVLPAGSTQTLTDVNHRTYGATGLPVISSVIIIEGQGSTIRRDSAAPEFRILAVNSTGDLTLNETRVSGGSATSFLNSNFYYYSGGGVFNRGTLTVTNSTISGNSADSDGGGVLNNYGTFILTNSTIAGNTTSIRGGGVGNSFPPSTFTIIDSTISGNSARYGGGGVGNVGNFTVLNSTIAGNATFPTGETDFHPDFGGGGVDNAGTIIVTDSTISGNAALRGGGVINSGIGGGVSSSGTLTILNSTISGNYGADVGGGVSNSSTLHVLNSTISGNSAGYGGGVFNGLIFIYGGESVPATTIAGTLVAGNDSPTGPEIVNRVDLGIVVADNHNLFGVSGNAGVVGFSPGPTDVVPGAGVQLSNILNPTLANNGGPTQTHALVPGSLAIDAGGAVCSDANGNPLLTDQRGKPRAVDGNSDGTAACDIGAFEFFPIVNNFVALKSAPDTDFDPAPVTDAPAGTFTITATFTNTSKTPLRFPFFGVSQLTGENLVLNADGGPDGVGATVTPEVAGDVLAPGASVTAEFIIGLQEQKPFTFLVNLFGEPLVSGTSKSENRIIKQ